MSSRCAKLKSATCKAKQILARKFKSQEHAKYWKDFERVLMDRTMITVLSKLLLTILFTIGDQDVYKQTEEYIEKGGPPNLELTEQIYPYAKAII